MGLTIDRKFEGKDSFNVARHAAKPIYESDIHEYPSGLKNEFLSASRKKESLVEVDQIRASFKIRLLEQATMLGILTNHFVANKIAREIEIYESKLQSQSSSSKEDQQYLQFLYNAAVQAALIHHLTYTQRAGKTIYIPSTEVLRVYKADFYLNGNEENGLPVICRSIRGIPFSGFTDQRNIPDSISFIPEIRFHPAAEYPKQKLISACRAQTNRDPLMITIPYRHVSYFLDRNWDAPSALR